MLTQIEISLIGVLYLKKYVNNLVNVDGQESRLQTKMSTI